MKRLTMTTTTTTMITKVWFNMVLLEHLKRFYHIYDEKMDKDTSNFLKNVEYNLALESLDYLNSNISIVEKDSFVMGLFGIINEKIKTDFELNGSVISNTFNPFSFSKSSPTMLFNFLNMYVSLDYWFGFYQRNLMKVMKFKHLENKEGLGSDLIEATCLYRFTDNQKKKLIGSIPGNSLDLDCLELRIPSILFEENPSLFNSKLKENVFLMYLKQSFCFEEIMSGSIDIQASEEYDNIFIPSVYYKKKLNGLLNGLESSVIKEGDEYHLLISRDLFDFKKKNSIYKTTKTYKEYKRNCEILEGFLKCKNVKIFMCELKPRLKETSYNEKNIINYAHFEILGNSNKYLHKIREIKKSHISYKLKAQTLKKTMENFIFGNRNYDPVLLNAFMYEKEDPIKNKRKENSTWKEKIHNYHREKVKKINIKFECFDENFEYSPIEFFKCHETLNIRTLNFILSEIKKDKTLIRDGTIIEDAMEMAELNTMI